MRQRDTPQDDLEDVVQLTGRLTRQINKILDGNDNDIAISAAISANFNFIFQNCDNVKELIFYKEVIDQMFMMAILSSKPPF